MQKNILHIHMLGGFSIELNGLRIEDSVNRSRKVWLLLAYLIYHRRRPITQSELTDLLFGGAEAGFSPSAIRALFHRARALLNQLQDNIGHELIISKQGLYVWNADFPLILDVEEFDRLCCLAKSPQEENPAHFRQALALYKGDLLPKYSGESWVIPVATYYRNMYADAMLDFTLALESKQQYAEVISLCKEALRVDPYSEGLYFRLIKNLNNKGQYKDAIATYEELNRLLLATFGITPAPQTRDLYSAALAATNATSIPLENMLKQLREPEDVPGALVCNYEFFKAIYYSTARMIARSGIAAHVGQISVSEQNDKALSQCDREDLMQTLQELIRAALRKGDVVARCSISQYALLLTQTNFENGRIVCERIINKIRHHHAFPTVDISYDLQPLEISTSPMIYKQGWAIKSAGGA